MSGRAFKYLTQPTRTDFNLRRDQKRSHPERSAAKSKDSTKISVGFATGFLDFARNDGGAMRRLIPVALVPRVSRSSAEKYAGNDCPAGQGRGQLRGWRVQAQR